jgi:hypothetical protein
MENLGEVGANRGELCPKNWYVFLTKEGANGNGELRLRVRGLACMGEVEREEKISLLDSIVSAFAFCVCVL